MDSFDVSPVELRTLQERIHDMSLAQPTEQASRAFVKKYNRRLDLWAGRGDPDVLQDVYLHLLGRRALSRWDPGKASLPTFLRTVVHNCAIGTLRRGRKEPLLEAPAAAEPADLTTEEGLIAADLLRALRERLSPREQRLLGLAMSRDLSGAEIAEAMSYTVATVHTRMKELRKKVRLLLQELDSIDGANVLTG